MISMVGALKGLYKPLLLPDTENARALAERCSHPDAFRVSGERIDGERVLVVDDLVVSGAHVQSAASALYEAGAHAVVALVIVRLITFDSWSPHRERIWEEASAEPFDFDRCCLCRA
ncbi:hypothetical protein ACIBCT_31665 [Streptosporangium sp. NPDC050855]|uniref:hypothetical protein n=1 Tax=Streptosporangium sp. NPDC050855 TaxID=3366194 RepID=UPI0037A47216